MPRSRPSGQPARIRSGIVNCLRTAEGRPVSYEDIIQYLYGHRADGGPLTARVIITVEVHELRKCGFPIKTFWGRGYSYDPAMLGVPLHCGARRSKPRQGYLEPH